MDVNREVTYADISAAHERIRAHARRTPVLDSATVNALTGATVFFKCENFQRMGAFKFRGAYNALSQLSPQAQERGVVAFSSGNHAQAVALAGRMLGIPRVIVMPQDAPRVKLEATRGYGAQVVTYGPGDSREAIARRLAEEKGMTLIPPFNHPHITAGQGTAAKELLEETGPLDVLLVPCGGGSRRRRHALVPDEDAAVGEGAADHRRRRAHRIHGGCHLPAHAAVRGRDDDGVRRGPA